MNEKSTVTDYAKAELCWGLGAVVLVLILWFAIPYVLPKFFESPQQGAHYAAMFGSVSALFSGLAFVALVITLLMQNRVLELQRQQFKEAQEQLKTQTTQLEAQAELLMKQTFEDTFFRMMEVLREQAKEIAFVSGGTRDTGQPAFKSMYGDLQLNYVVIPVRDIPPGLDRYDVAMGSLLRRNPDLLNYFGTFVHTLSFVDKSGVEDKAFYGTYMSTQLRDYEKLLLFYYCLDPNLHKTKARIEEYFVFTGIKQNELLNPEHRFRYNSSAWAPHN